MESNIEKLKEYINKSNNIVFFGGAGVSTESNIPDFRSANGLWSENLKINLTPEQLVSHTMYMRYPEEFFEFYKDKLIYPESKPNAAHIALAKLEKMGIMDCFGKSGNANELLKYFKIDKDAIVNKVLGY